MKDYNVEQIRTTGIFGHGGVGKTSIVENILFKAGQNTRIGLVDEGNSICDYDDEEKQRRFSIHSSVVHFEWKDKKIHLIDTPGYADFIGDLISTMQIVDSAIITISASSGIEVRANMVFEKAQEKKIPSMFFINKLDKDNVDFASLVKELQNEFGQACVPLMIPIGKEADLSGVASLLDKGSKESLDDAGKALWDEYQSSLFDSVAELDDQLLERYLETGELSSEEIIAGLKKGITEAKIFPILCGFTHNDKDVGIDQLMDFIAEFLPSPVDHGEIQGYESSTKEKELIRKPDKNDEFSAYVFKSIADPFIGQLTFFRILSGTLKADSVFYNINTEEKEKVGQLFFMLGKEQKAVTEAVPGDIVAVAKLKNTHVGNTLCTSSQKPFFLDEITYPNHVAFAAIVLKSKGDEEKISDALHKLSEEDPTFAAQRNVETKELVIAGMGDLHLDITTKKMAAKFHVSVDLKPPKIAYKETVRSTAKAQYKHKKQSGGHGQYGEVYIAIKSLPRGEDFSFVDKIVGGVIPKQFIPAVEKGVHECMEVGVLAKYPVIDVEVALYDGSFHTVDSSELAFKIAGSMAFKKAFMDAKPVLLEPIMNVEIMVPKEHMGDISGHLNSKRGKIMGMEDKGKNELVKAHVPQSEMSNYVGELRSMTSGKGTFSMAFSHYEEVPDNLAQNIINEVNKEKAMA